MKFLNILSFKNLISYTIFKSGKGALYILDRLLKEEGIKGLFKGIKASLVLVLNPIIQFFLYEALKNKYKSI